MENKFSFMGRGFEDFSVTGGGGRRGVYCIQIVLLTFMQIVVLVFRPFKVRFQVGCSMGGITNLSQSTEKFQISFR